MRRPMSYMAYVATQCSIISNGYTDIHGWISSMNNGQIGCMLSNNVPIFQRMVTSFVELTDNLMAKPKQGLKCI